MTITAKIYEDHKGRGFEVCDTATGKRLNNLNQFFTTRQEAAEAMAWAVPALEKRIAGWEATYAQLKEEREAQERRQAHDDAIGYRNGGWYYRDMPGATHYDHGFGTVQIWDNA